ncbi:hypothetical protein GCK32_011863, partial [Trichostrongylus colubriformis]
MRSLIWLAGLITTVFSYGFNDWLPPFNESTRIYELCTNEMDEVILIRPDLTRINFYMEKYVLCYPDFAKFVPKKDQGLVWMMRSLRFCEVNQIFAYSRLAHTYHREFQTRFLKYAYALICDKGRLVAKEEHFNLYMYSSLFKALYERDNVDRMQICQRVSDIYSDLYSRCYVPHVSKRQRKISERCSGTTTPLLKFPSMFQRFSRHCDNFSEFVGNSLAISNMGLALSEDILFMNLLGSSMVSNIHSDSELPSLVLKTRLVLQNFSVAAIKLWKQIEQYVDKSPELIVAESLQTHLFASNEFRKHLIQETLYSLAQNGSLIGLIHLLVLVLLVINRSMAGKSIHLSRVSVISVFACVWMFLIMSHVLFSTLQISAIKNLDELFSTLSKGKTYLQCEVRPRSNYEEIATQCDRTAVFHAFGAYLLRGHTLFTLLFLAASIMIFTITVAYHFRIRRQHDFIHSGL